MAERIFAMPDLGEGLEEGIIVEWLVAEGDTVELNQPLLEVDTAKATVEIPSPHAGVVRVLHGAAGAAIPVGAPLVTFQVVGSPQPSDAVPPRSTMVTPTPSLTGTRPGGAAAATPPVRRLAKEVGIDIGVIDGSGVGGRVLEADVRRQIAASLTVQAAIPQVTTFRAVDCTALQHYRKELGLSPLPVVVAALCRTVQTHPLLNARWAGDHIELRGAVNVGIAVDTDRGLVVPVVQDAGRTPVSVLASQITRVARGARSGKLTLDDIAPTPTIAVSNTGSYGSEAGTPILSRGTSVTLGLGVIAPRALVVDGQVQVRQACTLSLTFDHRVLDGAATGAALTDLVDLLQSPERLQDLAR